MYLTSTLDQIQPQFKCSQSCVTGRSSNGFLKGTEVRTRECFWLGKPYESIETTGTDLSKWNIKEQHEYCADSTISLCYTNFRSPKTLHNGRYFIFSDNENYTLQKSTVTLCDLYHTWTLWLAWTEESKIPGMFKKLKRRRFCFFDPFTVEELSYKYIRYKESDSSCQLQPA